MSFDRKATTGALTPAGCIQDVGKTGCGANQQGLAGLGRRREPGGRSVFVASAADDAIARFDREPFDTDPPETEITKGPARKTEKRKAILNFTSDEPASTFECSLDGKDFEPCTSPHKVRVRRGRHSFQVRAIDAVGNVDASPAEWRWRVRKD